MGKKNDLVWYACYGSNLLESRFFCYIKGGVPEGSKKEHQGCTDKSPPKACEKYFIPHQLYFAEKSKQWDNCGVAFIKSTPFYDECEKFTYARKYLITKEQFVQVLRQENGKDIDDTSINIDFEIAEINKYFLVGKEHECKWYGKVINLGKENGIPIFTFTAKNDFIDYNPPSDKYLKIIIKGIKETFKIEGNEIIDYLISIHGIQKKMSKNKVEILVKNSK